MDTYMEQNRTLSTIRYGMATSFSFINPLQVDKIHIGQAGFIQTTFHPVGRERKNTIEQIPKNR